MCGFDALIYAVCRKPAELAPSLVEGPDCASIRTTIATAAITPIRTIAVLAFLMSVSDIRASISNAQLPTPKKLGRVDFESPWKLEVGDWEFILPRDVRLAAAGLKE